jgi:hypothetical protein
MKETDHNRVWTARILCIHRTLIYKKRKYGLDA